MENVKEINWLQRQRELENSFSERFRKVWIQYSRLGSICITAFPIDRNMDYEIYTAFKIDDFSVENLRNIVLSKSETVL
jgi:hypothetical protein